MQGFTHAAPGRIITYLHPDETRPGDLTKSGSASPKPPSCRLMNLPALRPPPTAVSPASLPPVPHCWGFPSSCSDVLPAGLLSLLTTLPETQTHTYTHTLSCLTCLCSSKAVLNVMKRPYEHMGHIINSFIVIVWIRVATESHPF